MVRGRPRQSQEFRAILLQLRLDSKRRGVCPGVPVGRFCGVSAPQRVESQFGPRGASRESWRISENLVDSYSNPAVVCVAWGASLSCFARTHLAFARLAQELPPRPGPPQPLQAPVPRPLPLSWLLGKSQEVLGSPSPRKSQEVPSKF